MDEVTDATDVISRRLLGNPRRELVAMGREAGLYPYFRSVQSACTPMITVEGTARVNLASNSYLSLTDDPRVVEAAVAALHRYGTGTGGSRFLNGTTELHLELEAELCSFYGKDGAILTTAGYTANLAILGGLLDRHDVAIIDRDAHNSLHTGVALSGAKVERFRHNDPEHLAAVLARVGPDRGKVVVVDGVYSMIGDLAPLPELLEVCRRVPNTLLVVDECHGLGAVGPTGRGAVEHFGVLDEVDFVTVSFSKALASCGGAILGRADLLDAMASTGRMPAYVFTTSNTPGSLGAALAALRILRSEPSLLDRLRVNVERFQAALAERGVPFRPTSSAIVTIPLPAGDDVSTGVAGGRLLDEGLYCNPVLHPAVPAGHGLLRFSLMAGHTEDQLLFAADAVARTLRDLGQLSGGGDDPQRTPSELFESRS